MLFESHIKPFGANNTNSFNFGGKHRAEKENKFPSCCKYDNSKGNSYIRERSTSAHINKS